MKGNDFIISRIRLFKEWSKLIGFSSAIKLFTSFGKLFTSMPIILAMAGGASITLILAIILSSCQGLTFEEKSTAELKLVFGSDSFTKAYARDFPDSNSFLLTIKSVSGVEIYNGTYGNRPATLELEAGTYEVNICSRVFITPAFDAPCYSDSKTVVIQSNRVYVLSLLCRQSNVGLRINFSNEFMGLFTNHVPEILDSKGSMEYNFYETRFAYLNPGSISVRMKEVQIGGAPTGNYIPILDRVVTARDMLTINLHANPENQSGSSTGVEIDTSSNWVYEYIVFGGSGDGITKESAFTVEQIAQNVGKTGVWVTGYIVGGDLTTTGISFEAPFGSATNLAIASSPTIRDRVKCVSVSIPTGELRDLLNLNTNPSNLGRKVYLKGTIAASYFGLVGINPLNDAQF